ncbi:MULTISPECIES: LacI family DNA-binding transcriptional regulator [Olivibacter]|uniref:Transcriptional regulator, LacI family n=3 Tax=Sphingobacteriaceae TaxID=84566 RepID=F4C5L6_SPHS2|nr:LacI family DNA-binding transcriptional regulator [Olivibacter jilunii]MCL4639190.1 LacI family transcriptional regulator [Olivibacter sp. UJ_SKK_5.1]MDX3913182.1 LacI family DNA-binding transcriptional regulator [Pseudosphingobacterium sp.]
MNKGKQPTIKEIAKRLKISTSTVSRALNDHPSIGLITTMRVKKLAEELNYEPNRTAIFFKQRKTFTIGVILPSLSEAFFSAAISEIENFANSRNYTVILGQSLDDPERELKIINTMKVHRVDGIILSSAKNTREFEYIEILRNAGIPVVFFDCVPDLVQINAIVSNLKTGMKEAIDTFASCGHRGIAFINGPAHLPASKEREEAFIDALVNNGIPLNRDYIVYTDLSEKGNTDATLQLINLSERPSAVVSFNDYVTLDAMNAVRSKGLTVNQDIFFISYANYPIWKYMENPPMASIEQLPGKQGALAAEMLFELIDRDTEENADDSGIKQGRKIVLESKLVNQHV